MLAVFVAVSVKPASIDAFLEATEDNHRNSLLEPGCERFDVLRDSDDSNVVYLYEVYHDKAANAAHKETAHYQRWAETVADMMATPRSSIKTETLFPQEWV